MSSFTSRSTSSDLAKGKKFLKKLLYVQHVDKEKDTASEISNRCLKEYLLADRTNFHDSDFMEYLKSPKGNLGILKSSLEDEITEVTVYSNPLPIPLPKNDVTIHAFVVFKTRNTNSKKEMWWSLEKNGKYIVLQQSPNKDDVINKKYDTETKTSVERLGPIKRQKSARPSMCDPELEYELYLFRNWRSGDVMGLMRMIVDTNKINDPYHLLYSNCQNFASFLFEHLCNERWPTVTSEIVKIIRIIRKIIRIRWGKVKIHPKIRFNQKVDEIFYLKYKTIDVNDDKFYWYWAMIEGRWEYFRELINDLTSDSLNRVDSQGYTLLEWATVFSSSDWPIDEELKEKGAEFSSDEKSLKQNLFFIALQYLPPNQKSEFLNSFDGIDIMNGVNKKGETALHLALNGEKWKIAEEILNRFDDFDVNSTNSIGDTPLLLAARLKCEFGLLKKILNRTNSENINKVDGNENTALHYAMLKKSETEVEELLKREDVDVDIKNRYDGSALHLASDYWRDIPSDLFNLILEKTTDVNSHSQYMDGHTALHYAIIHKSEIMTKALLNHKDVDVNVKNNNNETALHLASKWKDIPVDLFKQILEKSTDVNAQDEDGWTALHFAIWDQSKTQVEELLKHENVDVDMGNPLSKSNIYMSKYDDYYDDYEKTFDYKTTVTALHLASIWTNIPVDLFKIILEKSTDVNAQDEGGDTPLHLAILSKSKIATKELLSHSDVDVNIKEFIKEFNYTPLHLASKWPNIPAKLFKKILEKSKDVNAQDEEGETALHLAISEKSETATKILLAHKDVNVNVKNNENETVLHLACGWPNIPSDLFKIILERYKKKKKKKKYKNINSQNKEGWTALHYATFFKSKIATKALLGHKDVNVNVKNKNNWTPLHLASKWKEIPADLFKLILEKSDINAQDKDGKTALQLAISYFKSETVKELLTHEDVDVNVKNNDKETALHLASDYWKDFPMDLFQIILEKSKDVNAQKTNGDTALHCAIWKKSKIATKALLGHKDVNVNVKNKNNWTPLHLASKWKEIPVDLFQIILEKSTNVINVQDHDRDTALHCAIISKSEIATKELLARSDVDVNIRNNRNRTALSYASKWKDIPSDLFKLISERSANEVEKISKMDRLSKYLRNLTVHK